MRQRDPAAKALVFTQFSSTLTWLAARLQQEGYGYRTISGSMPLKKRAQVFFTHYRVELNAGLDHAASLQSQS